MTDQPKRGRSGTRWSEADYRKAGWHQVKVRLDLETLAKLEELEAEHDSRGECLRVLIAEAHARRLGSRSG